jgi:hypothetical protein
MGLSVFPALEKQGQSLLGWRDTKKKSSGKRGMSRTKKREPPGKAGRLLENSKLRRLLLVDHLLDHIADDGQLEHFVAVSLVHKKYPGREDGQTKDREDDQAEEADEWYVSDDKPDNPKTNPDGNDAYVERN